jgi:hypothetical protein
MKIGAKELIIIVGVLTIIFSVMNIYKQLKK